MRGEVMEKTKQEQMKPRELPWPPRLPPLKSSDHRSPALLVVLAHLQHGTKEERFGVLWPSRSETPKREAPSTIGQPKKPGVEFWVQHPHQIDPLHTPNLEFLVPPQTWTWQTPNVTDSNSRELHHQPPRQTTSLMSSFGFNTPSNNKSHVPPFIRRHKICGLWAATIPPKKSTRQNSVVNSHVEAKSHGHSHTMGETHAPGGGHIPEGKNPFGDEHVLGGGEIPVGRPQ
uniref:Uncharacterized protein n=1 Tax=Fagus sylvatica TaxID=28930 RepID=A0A2N9GVF8_FAGSY